MKGRGLHGLLLAGLVAGVCGLVIHPRRPEAPRVITSQAVFHTATVTDVMAAINSLQLDRAQELMGKVSANAEQSAALRARLALYRGDCDEARAILRTANGAQDQVIHAGLELAEGCARAVAGAKMISDASRGVWIRIQDDADESLAQLVADVAARARDATAKKLGISLPRPLRIELVMDQASLSALTGLPLQAAETTGTVAVARWGRVTMLSPRSFAKGYPWQDTLAHEITHLLVTAATRDNAPLWLQESLAKHFEVAWRPPRPLDDIPNQHALARNAWRQGRSVGIDKLGSSIALLPSPESARIAYAEVYDFLDFILLNTGWSTVRLLLHELRDLGADSSALVSTTGYSQPEWILRWRAALSKEEVSGERGADAPQRALSERDIEVARRTRLAELFVSRRAWAAVDKELLARDVASSDRPEVRALAGLAKLQQATPERAVTALGSAEELATLQGEWLALRGRALMELGRTSEADLQFDLALAFAPTEERVSCEGRCQSDSRASGSIGPFSTDPARRALCLAARELIASAGHPPVD
jgi:hypothetical protein